MGQFVCRVVALCQEWDIYYRVNGRGGHASQPEQCQDRTCVSIHLNTEIISENYLRTQTVVIDLLMVEVDGDYPDKVTLVVIRFSDQTSA